MSGEGLAKAKSLHARVRAKPEVSPVYEQAVARLERIIAGH
jgi:hypothetical protein